MATILGSLGVVLSADTSALVSGLDRASSKVSSFGRSISAAGVRAGVGFAVSGFALKKVIGVAADFEEKMVFVGSVSGAASDELDLLRSSALKFASATQFSATQAAEAMTSFGLAGLNAGEIIAATRPTMDLAAAGMVDLKTAADISLSAMKGFGRGTEDLGEIVDVLANTMTNTNTDITSLGEGFKFVAPIAKAAGIGFNETSAALGLLANAGIKGSLAGTSLKGIIAQLLTASGEAADTIERLGVKVLDSSGSMNTLESIISQLNKGGADATDIFKIFGKIAGPGMAALMEQGGKALGDMTEKVAKVGTAQAIAAKQINTTAGQFKILASQVERAAIDLGTALFPAVKKVTTVFQNLLTMFIGLSPEMKKNIALFAGIGVAALGAAAIILPTIGLMASGLGALGGVISSVLSVGVGAFTKLASAVMFVGKAFLTTFLPLAGIVAGGILLVGAFKKAWDADLGGIQTAITSFATNAKFEWGELMKGLSKATDKFFGNAKEKFILLKAFFSGASPEEAAASLAASKATGAGAAEKVVEGGAAAAGLDIDLKSVLEPVLGALKEGLGVFGIDLDVASKAVSGALDGAKEKVTGFVDSAQEKFDLLKNKLLDLTKSSGTASKALDKVANATEVSAVESPELSFFEQFAESLTVAFDETVSAIKGAFDFVVEGIKSIADLTPQDVLEGIKAAGRAILDTADAAVTAIGSALVSVGRQMLSGLGIITNQVIASATGAVGEAANAAKEGFAAGGIFGAIFAVIGKFLSKTEGIGEMFDIMSEDLGGLTKALAPLGKVLKNLTKNVSGSVQKVFAQFGKALEGLLKGAKPLFRAIANITKFVNAIILIILKVLTPILKALGKVLGVIGNVISFVVKIIVKVINFVIGVISKVVGIFSKKAGKAIGGLKISLSSSRQAIVDFGFAVRQSAESVKSNIGKMVTRFEDGSEVFQAAMDENSAATKAVPIRETIENLKLTVADLTRRINSDASRGFPKLNERLRDSTQELGELQAKIKEMGGTTFTVTEAMENLSLSIDESAVAMVKQTATLSDGSKVTIDMSKTIVSQADKLQARIKELVNNLGVSEQQAATQAAQEFGVTFVDASKKAADAMGDVADTAKEVASKLTNVPAGFKIALERFNASTGLAPSAALDLGTGSLPGSTAGGAINNNITGDVTNINIDKIEAMDPETLAADLMAAEKFKRNAQTGTSQPSGAPFAVDSRGA